MRPDPAWLRARWTRRGSPVKRAILEALIAAPYGAHTLSVLVEAVYGLPREDPASEDARRSLLVLLRAMRLETRGLSPGVVWFALRSPKDRRIKDHTVDLARDDG